MSCSAFNEQGEVLSAGAHTFPVIGARAPLFVARTTMGQRALSDYRGRWLLFFSHPADFTPVCTSEFVSFSRHFDDFQSIGCDLLAMSIDSLASHFAWLHSIQSRFGVRVPFPIAEDSSMAIAFAYGMLGGGAIDSSAVRATFVIDPEGVIRAVSVYPMSTGRSVLEALRLVTALQTADRNSVLTPEGWRPGDPVIEPWPMTSDDVLTHTPTETAPDWYYRLRKL